MKKHGKSNIIKSIRYYKQANKLNNKLTETLILKKAYDKI